VTADREFLALRGANGGEGGELHHQHEAEQDSAPAGKPWRKAPQFAHPPGTPDRHMHEEQPDQPAGAYITITMNNTPTRAAGVAEQADAALQQHNDDGTQDRPEEATGAPI